MDGAWVVSWLQIAGRLKAKQKLIEGGEYGYFIELSSSGWDAYDKKVVRKDPRAAVLLRVQSDVDVFTQERERLGKTTAQIREVVQRLDEEYRQRKKGCIVL